MIDIFKNNSSISDEEKKIVGELNSIPCAKTIVGKEYKISFSTRFDGAYSEYFDGSRCVHVLSGGDSWIKCEFSYVAESTIFSFRTVCLEDERAIKVNSISKNDPDTGEKIVCKIDEWDKIPNICKVVK